MKLTIEKFYTTKKNSTSIEVEFDFEIDFEQRRSLCKSVNTTKKSIVESVIVI